MRDSISPDLLRQSLFLLLIAGLFVLISWNLLAFIPALMGAYTIYVLLRAPMRVFTVRWKWNNRLAALVLLLISFVVIVLPMNGLILLLNRQLATRLHSSDEVLRAITEFIRYLEARTGFDFLTEDRINDISQWAMDMAGPMLTATLSSVVSILLLYILLWFLLSSGEQLERSFFNYLPLRPENIEYLREQLNGLVLSNAIGIPLMGIVQGLVGGAAYALAGVDQLWLWIIITAIAGMMPIFGAMLAYIPLSILLWSQGLHAQSIAILIYGFVVIGSVDNLARMWLLKKIGHTHPLITLFGVILGLKLFGFVGFIFGPITISMFLLLLRIYAKEFGK